MNASKGRVFYYHADASPIGGRFTLPIEQVVPSHGSSSLGQAGGYAASSVSSYRLGSLVSFKHAYSEIRGEKDRTSGSWTTRVTSIVEGLNVLDTVMADHVVATLVVEHPSNGGHPRVSFAGSRFENLCIKGVKVTPVLNKSLISPHQEGQFPAMAVADDGNFTSRAIGQIQKVTKAKGAPNWLQERYAWVQSNQTLKQKGCVLCSLVDEVQGAKPGSSFGHVVQVPDFGNIFLSELVTDRHAFRLTMIRMEMGCDNEGDISIGTGDSNGYPIP